MTHAEPDREQRQCRLVLVKQAVVEQTQDHLARVAGEIIQRLLWLLHAWRAAHDIPAGALLRDTYRRVIVDNAQDLRASQQLVARHHNLMVASDP